MEKLTHSPALGHITTFGGNPVIAAAHATLSTVLKKRLMDQIPERSLISAFAGSPKIEEIRGRGLMLAPMLAQRSILGK